MKKRPGVLLPLQFVFVMWAVFVVQQYISYDLGLLGINPRNFPGLVGVIAAPLLHGSLLHLVSNTLPILILGGFLFIFFNPIAVRVFILSYLLTGMLVWMLARGNTFHIGASGVVYALASFLIFYGLFKKNFTSLLISIAIIFMYGGLVYGVLPVQHGVSWESHLFGAITGIYLAFNFARSNRK